MTRFLPLIALLTITACGQFKPTAAESAQKHFSPLLYEQGETFPARFEGKSWDPALWPLPYQDRDTFTRQLFDSDIIHDQYIQDQTIPVLVVGPNFYHLSDIDQYRVTNALDQLYGATTGEYGGYMLQDYHTRRMIGSYTKAGLSLR